MSFFTKYIDKLLSSNDADSTKSVVKQCWGALLNNVCKHWFITLVALTAICGALCSLYKQYGCIPCLFTSLKDWGNYGFTILAVLIVYVCYMIVCVASQLIPIFNLRKQSSRTTKAQVAILISIAFSAISLVVIFMVVFGISKESPIFIPLTIIGVAMGWIFQDTLKSIAAYLYLAGTDKLHIDDWISIKHLGIDGEVQSITLTSVEIRNWDTTISLFPTHVLIENHFQNYQKMAQGRTLGRQMTKTFTFDTGWIHPLKSSELDTVKKYIREDLYQALCATHDIEEGQNNLHAFRMYLYNYLMLHEKVSHEPQLMVRIVEHSSGGIRMQVYAYLMETSLMAFEEEQSLIMEHIIASLSWFGLRLYQSPRGGSNDDEKELILSDEENEQE